MLTRDDLKPGSVFSGLFHKAWGQAKASPEYDKEIWKKLEQQIWAAPSDMAQKAKRRPPNYAKLSAREQWDIDKRLGILDWDGE